MDAPALQNDVSNVEQRWTRGGDQRDGGSLASEELVGGYRVHCNESSCSPEMMGHDGAMEGRVDAQALQDGESDARRQLPRGREQRYDGS